MAVPRCSCCGATGVDVVLAKSLRNTNTQPVLFCRRCDRYDLWPSVVGKEASA